MSGAFPLHYFLSKYFLKNTIELIAMQTATKQRKNEKYIQQKKQFEALNN
jgi:hypothetical protein